MTKEQLKEALINSGWFYFDNHQGLQAGYMEGVDYGRYLDDLLNEVNKFTILILEKDTYN